MKSEETFFKYPDFNNIKEIIYNSVEKYPNNIAFKIKEKNGEADFHFNHDKFP